MHTNHTRTVRKHMDDVHKQNTPTLEPGCRWRAPCHHPVEAKCAARCTCAGCQQPSLVAISVSEQSGRTGSFTHTHTHTQQRKHKSTHTHTHTYTHTKSEHTSTYHKICANTLQSRDSAQKAVLQSGPSAELSPACHSTTENGWHRC
jgi:hypothetical protein